MANANGGSGFERLTLYIIIIIELRFHDIECQVLFVNGFHPDV